MIPKMTMATVPVSDLSKAADFYEGKLGLHPLGSDGSEEWGALAYEAGDSRLFVYKTEAKSGDATVVSFQVDDLDSTMKELRDKGVRFEEYDLPGLKTVDGVASWTDDTYGEQKTAWFKDPDGNILAVGQGRMP